MEVKEVPREVKTVSPNTFIYRKYFFQGFLVFLIVAFGVLTFFAKNYKYFPFDLYITLGIQRINLPGFDQLIKLISFLGDLIPGSVIIFLAVVIFMVLKRRKDALLLLVSSVGVSVLAGLMKIYVSRPRPDPSLILQIGTFSRTDSFPSGHVLFFMGFYGFLLFLVFTQLKKGWLRRIVITLLTLMLILISISRIYLGAHWFSDTLGSYLIGTVWLYLMVYLYRRFKF